MTFNQIKYFISVAERGSFSAAARALNISQPALCYQLQTLEDRLQVVLLERHSRGARLTSAGRALMGPARNVLDAMAAAELSVERFRQAPLDLMLGVAPTPGRALLPDLMDITSRENIVRLTVRQGLSDELNKSMLFGEMDAALSYDSRQNSRFLSVPLYCEDLFVVGANSIIGEGPEDINLDDLSAIPLVIDGHIQSLAGLVSEAAKARGITLDFIEVEPINVRREIILRSNRCTIVPFGLFLDEIKSGQLNAKRIVNPTLTRTLHLLMQDRVPAAIRTAFVKIVTQLVESRIAEGELKWRVATATEDTQPG